VPLLSLAVLAAVWGSHPSTPVVIVIDLFLAGSVLAAVHHAEVIAARVGEPFGSLVLAVAVTVIEVGLIITLMVSGGDETETLARDTVFAAVMITCNGIIGLSILTAALRHRLAVFNAEGSATAFATVATLATLSLVLPSFTTSKTGPEFSGSQLAFAAVASIALYGVFLLVQTVRHRGFFLPAGDAAGAGGGGGGTTGGEVGAVDEEEDDGHGPTPSRATALRSLGLLVVALVVVVGLAKTSSGAIEDGVKSIGAPQSAVGVVIALLVLAPESLAAWRTARRGRVQISFNLAYGSAMASIGLTIPAIAVASIWLDGPLVLGLGSTQICLLVLTAIVSGLTLLPGRATLQEGAVHLLILAAFLFLAFNP
jgi:Ca2+:H+ antiporter